MRYEKIVQLDEPPSSRIVKVREIQVPLAENILARSEDENLTLLEEVAKFQFANLLALLGDCIEFSPEVGGCEGLSFSEVEKIKAEFLEVNRPFFDHAAAAGGLLLQLLAIRLTPSLSSAQDSSDSDIPT